MSRTTAFRRNAIGILSGVLAVIFTGYIALDTFVISRVYEIAVPAADVTETVAAAVPETVTYGAGTLSATAGADTPDGSSTADTAADEARTAVPEPVVTDTSYSDENIQITITAYREYDTDIYVADITLSSPEYLKTALAKASYGKNITETTSAIAEENSAILAINGDYYGVQEKGYVIRNGVLYRSTSAGDREDLAIYADGTVEIVNEQNVTAEELLADGVYNLLSFGPGLIEDGVISVTSADEVDKATASNPRTAFGVLGELHYVFVVADGRISASAGLSLYELAEFMQSLGVKTAYNLDGGGSSTLYFNGRVINNPVSGSGKRSGKWSSSSGGSERSVSDIVYIG